MDLITASESDIPLEYTVPVLKGTYLIAAHIFAIPGGVIIADAGWGGDGYGYCSSHPFHTILGTIAGEGPEWTVGHARIGQADVQQPDWHLYRQFQQSPIGREQTREVCARVLRRQEYLPA
jgi:hypothetical protein